MACLAFPVDRLIRKPCAGLQGERWDSTFSGTVTLSARERSAPSGQVAQAHEYNAAGLQCVVAWISKNLRPVQPQS